MPSLHHDWGRRPYGEIHALQQRLVALRAEDQVPNVLLTGEHDPVVTLGRRSRGAEPVEAEFEIVEVERGGEATYHGPGQLVAYTICHLTQARRDLHRFQRDLEEIGIRTLADFGIEAGRRPEGTGVWVGTQKIQSLGIAVRRWVTWHGLALNVSTDLSAFRTFRPCGLDGSVMTTLAEQRPDAPDLAAVRTALIAHASTLLPAGPYETGPLPPAALD